MNSLQQLQAPQKPKEKESRVRTANPLRIVFIEKIVLSCGATGDNLTKARKLLEFLTGKKAQIIASRKRIPDFDLSPGLEVGTRITLRDIEAIELLRRLLGAIDNKLKKKQISQNHFSFGIEEYIEIPGIEYQRDIGIRGFNVTVVFARQGMRVTMKKIKAGKLPAKQHISEDEIIRYMEEHFKTKFV